MLYKDKNNWSNLIPGESKQISQLLDAKEEQILRIGNDTSDESELTHMDELFKKATVLTSTSKSSDSNFILLEYDGIKFLQESIDDILAYYIVDEGTRSKKFTCYEIWRPNIPANGCSEQCKECAAKDQIKIGNKVAFVLGAAKHVPLYGEIKSIEPDTVNGGNKVHMNNLVSVHESAIMGKYELTLKMLTDLKPGVIAYGEIENSEDGLYMTNSNIGKKLLWVARRGDANDWAIYTHWAERGLHFVMTQGDKVHKSNVRKLVPCTDEALKNYRH